VEKCENVLKEYTVSKRPLTIGTVSFRNVTGFGIPSCRPVIEHSPFCRSRHSGCLCSLPETEDGNRSTSERVYSFLFFFKHPTGRAMAEVIVAGHSTRRPGFKLRPVHEGFLVDDVSVTQILPSPLSFQQ
jgi:hypothetical protein